MNHVERYLDAAERANTRRSYASAIRHFELEWGGLLPASGESIARYLAAHGELLSLNTLKHRLAALSRWHQEHGFVDPTKTHQIRQLLKGIRAVHPAQEKRARPLELEMLQQTSDWLEGARANALARNDTGAALRHARDRALVLLGFWRGFRADELSSLNIEFIEITPDEGMEIFLPKSKGDRQLEGRRYTCPALSRLCPVEAVQDWLTVSQLKSGSLFRKIDRWGGIGADGLTPGSIIPMLRRILSQAGVADADAFSSHSLRRGFAHWAHLSGWDIHELMSYVGWRDVKAAMRYLEGADAGLKARFERGLTQASPPVLHQPASVPSLPPKPEVAMTTIEVSILLTPYTSGSKARGKALRRMQETSLARYQAQQLDTEGIRYQLSVPAPSADALDEQLYALLDELHQIADGQRCFLETVCREPDTGKHWD